MLKKSMFLMVIALLLSVTNSLQAASVSLVASADGHVGNSTTGSGGVEDDGFQNGSAVNVRDIAVRRHVGFLQYNIGAVTGNVFSDMSFSIFSANNSGDPIEVYGIIESQDDFAPGNNVETAYTWNTAPGVFNSPTPPDGDPVQLDPNDTFGGAPLFLFNPPGSGIRASTPVSSLLADFLNADTDGTVVFMLVTENLGDVGTFRSSEHSSKGTFLEGEVSFEADVMQGEIAQCPDCGVELEVTKKDPLTLEKAPEEEEDWGE